MVTIHILSYAVLDYIDILPVLFVTNLFNILNLLPNTSYSAVLFCAKLQETCQHVWISTTLAIIFKISVLIFPNFNSISSIKVSGNSDRLPESIMDKINTLRLYSMCED